MNHSIQFYTEQVLLNELLNQSAIGKLADALSSIFPLFP